MKTKKITAVLMATAMAVSMAATTAMSASAEELDTPVQEEVLAESVNLGSTTINWGSRSDNTWYNLTDVVLYKTDFSDVSMANDAILAAKIMKTGSNYVVSIDFQPITKSVTIGNWSLINATAVVTDADASGAAGTYFTKSFTPDATGYSNVEYTFATSTPIYDVPSFSYTSGGTTYNVDPEYGVKIDFDTSFDVAYLNYIPAMAHPSAYMTFSIA